MANVPQEAVRAFKDFDAVVEHYPHHDHLDPRETCPGSTHLRQQDVGELILNGRILEDGTIVDAHEDTHKLGRVFDHSRFEGPRQSERLAVFDVQDTGPSVSRNKRAYDLLWGVPTKEGGISLRYNRIATGLGVRMLSSFAIPVDLQTVMIFSAKGESKQR